MDAALRSHSCAPGKQGSPSRAVPRGADPAACSARSRGSSAERRISSTSLSGEMTPKGVLDRSSSCFFLTSTKNHKIMGFLSLEKTCEIIESIFDQTPPHGLNHSTECTSSHSLNTSRIIDLVSCFFLSSFSLRPMYTDRGDL